MSLSARDFPAYFKAVHGHEPFPWQQMLVERVLQEGCWPQGIDLPTAAGKTACLDVAVFTLAASVGPNGKPTLPRRIFFVVDRRIVVDAAHQRARRIAEVLRSATDGVVAEVARRLRDLGGSPEPLFVSRQRGGIVRDDRWVRDPAQPTIVTGTVDQVGSRMLFRGYGPGARTQSIHAALVACDSLILLDEAHCARPFLQTARRVRRYAGPDWSRRLPAPPLQFVVLSATLPEDIEQNERFPGDRRAALDHDLLQRRIRAGKPARLVAATKAPPRPRRGQAGVGQLVPAAQQDKLVQHAADWAVKFAADSGRRRIAVMVNRVATAAAICEQLAAERAAGRLAADVVLLTGRMRPVDRDAVVERWSEYLRAGSDQEPPRPVILVTTQCLEVGADWDFDALITECAALDALRQRFGRLNRLGDFAQTDAVVLHRRKAPIKKLEDDPVYGTALDATWNWLSDHQDADGCVDFGIEALERVLPADGESLRSLAAPAADAPVLLPAHLDLLCQTCPPPAPDPDVSIFLHGPRRGVPEARLVFRCDLAAGDARDPAVQEQWLSSVALLPPCAGEMLSIPLYRLRQWLDGADLAGTADAGDTEHQRDDSPERPADRRSEPLAFLAWRGRHESQISRDSAIIRPNEVVVVRADAEAARRLGPCLTRPDQGAPLDVAERAYLHSGRRLVLRISDATLSAWQGMPSVDALLEWAGLDAEERDPAALADRLQAMAGEADERLPGWLRDVAGALAAVFDRVRVVELPGLAGVAEAVSPGVMLLTRRSTRDGSDFADADDLSSEADKPVLLDEHCRQVAECVRRLAGRLVDDPQTQHAVELAGLLHDAGKVDDRFQEYLRLAAEGDQDSEAAAGRPLAKSTGVPRTPLARRRARQLAGLPDGFRHEMLSMQLAERCAGLPGDPVCSALVLHLIASHHGCARPFAPICADDQPPAAEIALEGLSLSITDRQRRDLPAHRLDSGVAERFWRLTRHFGWWGLAFLEALLRLADWRVSESSSPGAARPRALQEVRSP